MSVPYCLECFTLVMPLQQEANTTVGHVVGGEAPIHIASLRRATSLLTPPPPARTHCASQPIEHLCKYSKTFPDHLISHFSITSKLLLQIPLLHQVPLFCQFTLVSIPNKFLAFRFGDRGVVTMCSRSPETTPMLYGLNHMLNSDWLTI